MNKNETLTLWLSIGAAIFAVMLLYSYTQERSVQISEKFGAMTSVVTAVQNIEEMATVDDSMVQMQEYPNSFVQPGALLSMNKAIGLVALAPISKGEQILETKIAHPGPTTGLSLQVSPTKRALTIPIDEMRGVAKLLKPGDRVDIIAAMDVKDGTMQKREVKTIMQDVPILATGIKVINELPRVFEEVGGGSFVHNIRSATNFTSITIETDPKSIQHLVYMLSTSPRSLFLALRHPSDRSINQNLPIADVDSLRGRVSKRTPAGRKKSSWLPKPPQSKRR